MTDKEKLDAIRAEIHRLVDVRGYDREMANDLFTFMDSLPNESVSKNLEEVQERTEPQFKVGDIIRNKVWDRAVHEIVSMDDSAYYFENGGKVEIANQEQWELVEEPVSEDLEEVEKSAPIVYVVTRCEEHSDYVEKVFFDGIKAEDYCKLFEDNENQYGRDITKVEVTL